MSGESLDRKPDDGDRKAATADQGEARMALDPSFGLLLGGLELRDFDLGVAHKSILSGSDQMRILIPYKSNTCLRLSRPIGVSKPLESANIGDDINGPF